MITATYNLTGERVAVTAQMADGCLHIEAPDGEDWFTTLDQIFDIETDDPLTDLTADPWSWVPSENGYDTELDWGLPAAVQSALKAWDAAEHPCANCGSLIGHLEVEDERGSGYLWRGCFATQEPVLFLCEDCA
jgi:hypothetical protein